MHTLATRVMGELDEALKAFGTYSFDDKGPGEVMGISELVPELRKLAPAEAAVVLMEIAREPRHQRRALRVAEALILDLQDWDALFEVPGIDCLMDGELPA